jgi:hypothetical protein
VYQLSNDANKKSEIASLHLKIRILLLEVFFVAYDPSVTQAVANSLLPVEDKYYFTDKGPAGFCRGIRSDGLETQSLWKQFCQKFDKLVAN